MSGIWNSDGLVLGSVGLYKASGNGHLLLIVPVCSTHLALIKIFLANELNHLFKSLVLPALLLGSQRRRE